MKLFVALFVGVGLSAECWTNFYTCNGRGQGGMVKDGPDVTIATGLRFCSAGRMYRPYDTQARRGDSLECATAKGGSGYQGLNAIDLIRSGAQNVQPLVTDPNMWNYNVDKCLRPCLEKYAGKKYGQTKKMMGPGTDLCCVDNLFETSGVMAETRMMQLKWHKPVDRDTYLYQASGADGKLPGLTLALDGSKCSWDGDNYNGAMIGQVYGDYCSRREVIVETAAKYAPFAVGGAVLLAGAAIITVLYRKNMTVL